ncbi:MAG TPA: hypothetical protein DEH78_05615 [Solibacterales bacterium]|nr:hypothetical protein [Bryobacterales bacterium]
MELTRIMDIIVSSTPADWHVMDIKKSAAKSHVYTAVYVPIASITIQWDRELNSKYKAPWTVRFEDSEAAAAMAEVFYNGALVFRDLYADVDGARCFLPIPIPRMVNGQPVFAVPIRRAVWIQLLDTLTRGATEFDDYFQQAGFSAVEEPWPVFSNWKPE